MWLRCDHLLWSHAVFYRLPPVADLRQVLGSTGRVDQPWVNYTLGWPLDTWQLHLRGLYHLYRSTQEDNQTALACFKTTIDRDPGYGPAHGGLAMAHVFGHGAGWLASGDRSVDSMSEAGHAAMHLSPRDPNGHIGWGWSMFCKGEFQAALDAIHKAVRHNPSSALAWYYLACVLSFTDEPQASIEKADRAMRLSPCDPMLNLMWAIKARSYYLMGDYEKAIEINRAMIVSSSRLMPLAMRDLAAALVGTGQVDEAKTAIKNLLRISPGYSLQKAETTYPWKHPDQLRSYLKHLGTAGLR